MPKDSDNSGKSYNLRNKNQTKSKSNTKFSKKDRNGGPPNIPGDLDPDELTKILAQLFPSKYMEDKVNKKQKSKKEEEEDEDDEDDEDYEEEEEDEDDEEEDDEDEEDSEYETESELSDESESLNKKKSQQVNIIFNIAAQEDDWESEEDSEYYSENDSEEETETEEEDDEEEEEEDKNDEEKEEEEEENNKVHKKINKKSNKEDKNCLKKNENQVDSTESNTKNEKALEDFKKLAEKLSETYGETSIVKKIKKFEKEESSILKKNKSKLEKKTKEKNFQKFGKLIREKNISNDASYFRKLSIDEQSSILNELEALSRLSLHSKPHRIALLESDIPQLYKASAMKKMNSLRYMHPGDGEYYKIKHWLDAFMEIPFGRYEKIPVTIDDGVENCQEFMENAKKTLDEAVFGLDDAKMQIMQFLGQLIANPNAIGSAVAIHGPMGTGKTTLVKEGISKILNRPFAFIALGGATDSSMLEGHLITYEGSVWGKIVDILIKCKCMNPVIYFDELDKVSDTPKGEEIIGILTHLTDTSQNTKFHDKYFSEIDFDLSKVLFIFSYNDESKVNPILRDRMYCIKTKGYEANEKKIIADKYLAPSIQKNVNFNPEDIIIPPETILSLIEKFTQDEKGVRNLKRCIEILYTKINLYRLMKPDSILFKDEKILNIKFPFTVTPDVADKLIKLENGKKTPNFMYL